MSGFALDTSYYNVSRKASAPDKAKYFEVKTRSSAGWKLNSFYISGKPQMAGEYTDDSFHIKTGEFLWYDSTGALTHRCNYENNKMEGAETFYYPNGKVHMTGKNRNDHPDGEWVGYYPSGKISGKATYKNGNQSSAEFFNTDGSPNKEMKVFMRDADFPGGPQQWLRFLNKTFRYPDQAVDKKIEGTVMVLFTVSKDGMVTKAHVEEPVNKFLDQEALRVVRESPEWQPAIMGGGYCDSYKRQPIIFSYALPDGRKLK